MFIRNKLWNVVMEAKKKKKELRDLSPRSELCNRRLSTKLVPTFADRWCRVVSATDPYGRILGIF
jgi:hypothetical protein